MNRDRDFTICQPTDDKATAGVHICFKSGNRSGRGQRRVKRSYLFGRALRADGSRAFPPSKARSGIVTAGGIVLMNPPDPWEVSPPAPKPPAPKPVVKVKAKPALQSKPVVTSSSAPAVKAPQSKPVAPKPTVAAAPSSKVAPQPQPAQAAPSPAPKPPASKPVVKVPPKPKGEVPKNFTSETENSIVKMKFSVGLETGVGSVEVTRKVGGPPRYFQLKREGGHWVSARDPNAKFPAIDAAIAAAGLT